VFVRRTHDHDHKTINREIVTPFRSDCSPQYMSNRSAADTSSRTVTIRACGHENVSAKHSSTLEVTSDDWLTPAGDCILAVDADTTPTAFGDEFTAACADANATISMTIEAAGHSDTVTGAGHPNLTHTDTRSLVSRTSTYIDDRTLMINADKAAVDIDRELVDALKTGAAVTVTLTVEP